MQVVFCILEEWGYHCLMHDVHVRQQCKKMCCFYHVVFEMLVRAH